MEPRLEISVGDVMKKDVETVAPEERVQSVADRLLRRGIHAVPVVDADGMVIGIVSESDFFVRKKVVLHLPSLVNILERTLLSRAMEEEDRDAIREVVSAEAKDIMTAPCITVPADMPLRDLLNLFAEKRFKTMPVVDGESRLVGVATLTDALAAYLDNEPSEAGA